MDYEQLRAIGWKPFYQQQLSCDPQEPVVIARVSAHLRSQVLMLGESGEFRVPVQLAESAGQIAVGDWLVLSADDHRAVQRLERQTLLTRRAAGVESKTQDIAANIDTMFIVSSCNEDFNLSRLERYLALALQAGATSVVVLTKADLCQDPAALRHQAERLQAGLLVETLDARQADHTEVLKPWCGPGQTAYGPKTQPTLNALICRLFGPRSPAISAEILLRDLVDWVLQERFARRPHDHPSATLARRLRLVCRLRESAAAAGDRVPLRREPSSA